MAKRYIVSKEVRDDDHPTGWMQIARFGSIDKALEFCRNRERLFPGQYDNGNLDRLYHMVELASK